MSIRTALAATAVALTLAACGGDGAEAPQNTAEAAPEAGTASDAELAADAALANAAAQAEAQDAAIGGTLNAAEVSAAPSVTVNGQ